MAVLASLAVGVGVSTAAFSFLDSLFLSPPPAVHQPGQVVAIFSETENGPRYLPASLTTYRALEDNARSLEQIGASQIIWVSLGSGDTPEQVLGEMATGSYFDTLGVQMAEGRGFTADESTLEAHARVVVISHRFWRDRLALAPDAVGQSLRLNGQTYEIVGVAPEGFKGVNAFNAPFFWLPLSVYEEVFAAPAMLEERNGRVLSLVARVSDGRSLDVVGEDIARVAADLEADFPADYQGQTLGSMPVEQAMVYPGSRSRLWRTSLFLMIIGGILLSCACVNVAIFLLLQASNREKEFAVRLSLGARRRDLIGQLLAEGLIFGTVGCLGGLLVAYWIWRGLWQFRPPYFSEHAFGFAADVPTVLFAAAVALATSLLFSLAPLGRVLASSQAHVLKDVPSTAALGWRRLTLGTPLVMIQVGLSTILLTGAGLFLESLMDSRRIDLGMTTERLFTMSWDTQSQGFDEARGKAFVSAALERSRAIPGVTAVSLAENRPLGGFRLLHEVQLWSNQDVEGGKIVVGSSRVDAEYFSILSIALVRGRGFEPTDRAGSPGVAVVNEALARQLRPDQPLAVVGESMRVDDWQDPLTIVGVAATVKSITPGESPRPALYLASDQHYSSRSTLHVQTAGEPEATLDAVRREVQALAPFMPLVDVGTVEDHVDRALWAQRMNVVVLTVFSVLALLLALIGVYATSAFAVAKQTREIGVRIALGAKPASVFWRVVARGVGSVLLGLTLGVAASYLLGRWIHSIFLELGSTNIQMLLTITLAMVLVGIVANLIPALRAVRVDPVSALRS